MAKGGVKKSRNQTDNMVFALDIGTRSIIGMVGLVENNRIKIIAIEKEEHTERVGSLTPKSQKNSEKPLQTLFFCQIQNLCLHVTL